MYHPTDAPIVKRVIGIGGDRTEGWAGDRITVNGKPIDADYLSLDPNAGEPPEFDVTVPDGSVFVAGDVRNKLPRLARVGRRTEPGAFKPEAVLSAASGHNA